MIEITTESFDQDDRKILNALIKVSGNLTGKEGIKLLNEYIRRSVKKIETYVIDLRELGNIDKSGLGTLVGLKAGLRGRIKYIFLEGADLLKNNSQTLASLLLNGSDSNGF